MAKMSKEVMDVFNDPSSAKVLATAGSSVLEINAAPKGSLRAVSEEVIAFADIFGDKTNKNLQLNKKVSALADNGQDIVHKKNGQNIVQLCISLYLKNYSLNLC